MSHPQSITANVMPPFTARHAWRMPVFVVVSLLLHLALIAGFLRNDNVPALLMAGAEGGVVAMTMVSVASHRLPVASHRLPVAPTAEPLTEPAPQEKTETELPSRAIKMPALAQPDAVIKLPAANEKKRESAPRKVETPQQKSVREAPPVRRVESQPQNPPQTVKPVQAPIATATDTSGEKTAQTDTAAGAASSVSAARTGSSNSGRAQVGAGSSATQNVKALHRRVNYPQRAKAMGVEGRVRVKFNITASGTITDVRILSETPTGVFAAAIAKDMSRWRYQTQAEVNDQTVTIFFKLNGQVALEN
ncbi:TonB family protein [Erwinia sp. MYb416]|uniref:TonB family protein n=1 Tax=Erwinia sp. MYb416 TaxID=3108532 RepID=UPI003097AC7D